MNLKKLLIANPLYRILKLLETNQESSKIMNFLFWGFNLVLILILVINEIFGDFFVPVIRHLCKGFPETNASFYSILLYSTLLISIFFGLKPSNKPAFKTKVLLGLEIPLLVMVIIRQEMLYELNLSLRYLFLLFFAMILIYWTQFYFQHNRTNKMLHFLIKLRKFLLFAFAVYFSALFIITMIPIGFISLKNTLQPRLIEDLYLIGYLILNLLLIVILILLIRPVWFTFSFSLKKFKYLIKSLSPKEVKIYLSSIIILFSALYFLNIKTKDYIYLALRNEPSLLKQKEMFFRNIDKLEKELRQSASERYYYLGSFQENFFSQAFGDELNLNDTQKKRLQSAYNLFMYPFFYQDQERSIYNIEYEAENIYEQLFDQPMNQYDYDNYWFTIKDVHIDKQEINIKEYADIAEIEICETYSTESRFSEEIIVCFALPGNSVVTGLWISDDKNIDKKYPGLVAPSGAAQNVYLNEVRKQVDPALLSQIGPNEYLLRAFPILNKKSIEQNINFDNQYKNNYQFRLWFSYKTFISRNNNWVLPKLLYKWNLEWSDKTKTFIKGEIYKRLDNWLPEYVTAEKPALLQEYSATISDTIHISSKLLEPEDWSQFDDNIAFLIDGSYSMNKNRKELIAKFGEIKELFPNFGEMDCFVVGKEINVLKTEQLLDELNSNPQLFFGNTNYMDILENFTSKYKGYANRYESIILISDIKEYSYPFEGIIWNYSDGFGFADTLKPDKLACPFIIISLAEEDYLLDPNDYFNQLVYKSKGGFAKNKNDLFNLLNSNRKQADNLIVFKDGLAYFKSKAKEQTDTLFKDFAIKEYINHYELDKSVKLVDIDLLNEMAKKQHIVTRYSSMVALVNQEQLDSLKSAETYPDRYLHFSESNNSSNGVLGLLSTFGPSVPRYPEIIVVFMFLLLVCIMIYTDRFK
jgi:putative PEP-CTERM system integral membrane protein